jgi:hypothetical protein
LLSNRQEFLSLVNVAELFGAHGEMGAQLRAFDWSRSELGRPESWPTSLRTIVGMVLGSRFPMLIWWGPNLIQIYNDGYRAILGDKHPRSVAAPGHQVWSEIWHIVGPMAEGILAGGPPTWNEHLLLPIQRKGFLEEAYFTFSYSPIPDDRGSVGGVLVTVQETTEEVQGARQLRTLRDLGAVGNGTGSPREACREAACVLEANPADVPFALLYLAETDGRAATLAATAGVPRGSDAAVETIALDGSGAWPLAASAQARARLDVTDARLLGSLPGGPLASAG